MIRLIRSLTVVVTLAVSAVALAQPVPELPAPSPAAKVSQRVGLTDIGLEYSSPAAKGRVIYGGLVPWDKPWRAGANAATKLTISRDATIGGKAVAAGTYALVVFPSQKGFSAALSKELGLWSGKGYDPKDDVVRFDLASKPIEPRERMIFVFSETTDAQTRLDLEWDKTRLSVVIAVDTSAHASASIAKALENAWRPHANSARYLLENTKEYDKALGYVTTSLAVQKHWYNLWIQAQILAKLGKWAEAREAAKASFELGSKDANFFYKDAVSKALEEWKGK